MFNNIEYLKRVTINDFKSIKNLKVNFKKGLNIIIGKNSVGKSNFLNALYNSNVFSQDDEIVKYSSLEFVIDSDIFILENHYNLPQKPSINDVYLFKENKKQILKINSKTIIDSSKSNFPEEVFFNGKKIKLFNNKISDLLFRMGIFNFQIELIKFNIPNNLIYFQESGRIKFKLNEFPEFSNNSFIFFKAQILIFDFKSYKSIKKNEISKFILNSLNLRNHVIENLTNYTPIKNVRISDNIRIFYNKKEDELIIDNVKFEFYVNNNWLPWSQLSDGTKRLFYLVSSVSYHNGLILIEEPELGIHPHQLKLIMQFLKDQSTNKQLIISSHSPQVLDILEPNELNRIFIAKYSSEKGTIFEKLSNEKIKKAKDYMKQVGFLSDYWLLSDLED